MEELALHDLTFCARRLPRDLKDIMKREGRKVFVAGGFIRSVIANEHVNDVDVFTPTKEDAERLANELAGPGRKPYATDNAYTVFNRRITVQFIHRWTFTAPEQALESFDFTIAKAALWWGRDARWNSACDERFYADLAARRLVYTSPQRNEDAGGSILRVLKFYQRGYRIPLDSMGAVIARLMRGVDMQRFNASRLGEWGEPGLSKVITGLLREVDPLIDPDAEGHVDSSPDIPDLDTSGAYIPSPEELRPALEAMGLG